MSVMPPSEPLYDPQVAQAVRSLPQSDPPVDLLPAIMREIERETPRPRFKLAWYEIALGIFMTLMTGSILGGFWIFSGGISPLEVNWALQMISSPNPSLFIPVIFGGLLLFGGLGFVVAIVSLAVVLQKPDYQPQ